MKQNTPKRNGKCNGWTPQEIRAQMLLKGITPNEIAQAKELSRQSVTATIAGTRRGLKTRQAVAEALAVQVEIIWPDALLPLKERRRLRTAS